MKAYYQIKKSDLTSLGAIPCLLIEIMKEDPTSTKQELMNHLQAMGIPWFEKSYTTKVFQIMEKEGYPPFDY
jgi:hypothetical protein